MWDTSRNKSWATLISDYINDLPNCLDESIPSIFADDTNISVNATNVDQISVKLNTEIQKIHTWLTANKLTLNATKTEFMIIGSKHNLTKVQTDPIITIGNNNIKRVYKTKSLRIIIDDKLNWKENIHSICKKTYANLQTYACEENESEKERRPIHECRMERGNT